MSGADQMAPLLLERERGSLIAPWPRFFARQIDGLVCFFLLGAPLLLGVLPAMQQDEPALWFMALNVLVLLLTVVLEAVSLSLLGTTPGKWLLGLTVRDRAGKHLSIAGSLKREFLVLICGLGLFLPIISWITLLWSYRAVSRGEPAFWDRRLGYEVRHHRISRWLPFVVGAAPFVFLIPAVFFLLPKIVAGDFGALWMNPVTKTPVIMPMGWRYSRTHEQAADDDYIFVSPNGYVILRNEQTSALDLATYADAVKISPDFGRYLGEERKTDEQGRPYLELSFSRPLDTLDHRVLVRLWQTGPGDYWRLILAWRADRPASESEKAARTLQETLPGNRRR